MKMQFKQLKNILTRPLNYGGIREYSKSNFSAG